MGQDQKVLACPACGGWGFAHGSPSADDCKYCGGACNITRERALEWLNAHTSANSEYVTRLREELGVPTPVVENRKGMMQVTDSDITVILPALDVYIEYLENLFAKGITHEALHDAATKARSLKEKLLVSEVYD